MLDRLEFLLGEAFTALRRNTWMTFAAITTATMALFLLGSLGFTYLSVSRSAGQLSERVEMRVFLKPLAKPDFLEAMRYKIVQVPGVASATAVSREQAWTEFKHKFPDIVEDVENPLPDMVQVKLIELNKAPEVAARIQALPFVETDGVRYLDDERQLVGEGLKLMRWLGIALGGLMLLTSGVLIYNAIRMTVVARRREIRIMQLVGATRATVMTPMLFEGVVQGALGGALAGVLMWSGFLGVQRLFGSLSVQQSLPQYPAVQIFVWLTLAGACYGFVCSLVALRDPRKVRL